MDKTLLEIQDLQTQFRGDKGLIPAVDGVDITVHEGETVGIVGESGCGKSVTSLSVMRLLPKTNAQITRGSIFFKGKDLLQLSEEEMRSVRGKEIAMIFQEPMTALNPVKTIGKQLMEMPVLHLGYSMGEAREHAVKMLEKVHIPRADKLIHEYPHQLSGGMRQRVMIAMALSCSPDLLIADEPTTALDVTVQAQILDLMNELQQREHSSIVLITHDLGVVAEMCQTVYVMYAGQVVERAAIDDLIRAPAHPYTQGLMRSLPKDGDCGSRLNCIPGNVPLPGSVTTGCRFAERCSRAIWRCTKDTPPLLNLGGGRMCRCWLYDGKAAAGEGRDANG